MSQEHTELIEVVLGLLEQSKQQDESIQKAVAALEREKNALEAFRNDLKRVVGDRVGEAVQTALKTQENTVETHLSRIGDVTRQLEQAKKGLNWQNGLFYFGSLVAFMIVLFGLVWRFIPSMDEVAQRRAELSALNAQIGKTSSLKRLKTSNCNKQLCVKVIEKKCNYGSKGERYCVVDLK